MRLFEQLRHLRFTILSSGKFSIMFWERYNSYREGYDLLENYFSDEIELNWQLKILSIVKLSWGRCYKSMPDKLRFVSNGNFPTTTY